MTSSPKALICVPGCSQLTTAMSEATRKSTATARDKSEVIRPGLRCVDYFAKLDAGRFDRIQQEFDFLLMVATIDFRHLVPRCIDAELFVAGTLVNEPDTPMIQFALTQGADVAFELEIQRVRDLFVIADFP